MASSNLSGAPLQTAVDDDKGLSQAWQRWFSLLAQFFGSYEAFDTTVPTSGTWAQGNFVRNSAPSEAGSGGSKYVIIGWSCVASGTPGTWVACRCLTGN